MRCEVSLRSHSRKLGVILPSKSAAGCVGQCGLIHTVGPPDYCKMRGGLLRIGSDLITHSRRLTRVTSGLDRTRRLTNGLDGTGMLYRLVLFIAYCCKGAGGGKYATYE